MEWLLFSRDEAVVNVKQWDQTMLSKGHFALVALVLWATNYWKTVHINVMKSNLDWSEKYANRFHYLIELVWMEENDHLKCYCKITREGIFQNNKETYR